MYSILIVDDEPAVRQAILLMCDLEKFEIDQVYEADNSRQALELCRRERPDIVLTDIQMPGMDGLSFLRQAVNEFPGTRFAILSGFDSFSFMREAVRLSISDYLLKPVTRDDLEELMTKLTGELEQHQRRASDYQTSFLERYINDIACDRSNPLMFYSKSQNFLFDQPECFQLGIVKLLNIRQIVDQGRADSLTGAQSLAVHELRGALGAGRMMEALINYKQPDECFLLVRRKRAADPSEFTCAQIQVALKKLHTQLSLRTVAVVSCLDKFNPNRILSAYASVHELLYDVNVFGALSRVYPPGFVPERTVTSSLYGLEELLVNACQSGALESAMAIVHAELGQLAKSHYYSIRLHKKLIDEFVLMINGIFRSTQRQKILVGITRYDREAILHCDCDLDSLSRLFDGMLRHACSIINDEHGGQAVENTSIHLIKEYIDQNYDKRIHLEMFSQRFFVCKEQLSRLFRKAYGCGIYEYLLQVRMRHAAGLLLHTNRKVHDIGRAVGYEDFNYFSKAFKSNFGISPAKYRAHRGADDPELAGGERGTAGETTEHGFS